MPTTEVAVAAVDPAVQAKSEHSTVKLLQEKPATGKLAGKNENVTEQVAQVSGPDPIESQVFGQTATPPEVAIESAAEAVPASLSTGGHKPVENLMMDSETFGEDSSFPVEPGGELIYETGRPDQLIEATGAQGLPPEADTFSPEPMSEVPADQLEPGPSFQTDVAERPETAEHTVDLLEKALSEEVAEPMSEFIANASPEELVEFEAELIFISQAAARLNLLEATDRGVSAEAEQIEEFLADWCVKLFEKLELEPDEEKVKSFIAKIREVSHGEAEAQEEMYEEGTHELKSGTFTLTKYVSSQIKKPLTYRLGAYMIELVAGAKKDLSGYLLLAPDN